MQRLIEINLYMSGNVSFWERSISHPFWGRLWRQNKISTKMKKTWSVIFTFFSHSKKPGCRSGGSQPRWKAVNKHMKAISYDFDCQPRSSGCCTIQFWHGIFAFSQRGEQVLTPLWNCLKTSLPRENTQKTCFCVTRNYILPQSHKKPVVGTYFFFWNFQKSGKFRDISPDFEIWVFEPKKVFLSQKRICWAAKQFSHRLMPRKSVFAQNDQNPRTFSGFWEWQICRFHGKEGGCCS